MKPTISVIGADRIERAIQQRYSPFPELTMEGVSQRLNEFRTGELRAAARMWESMLERDLDLVTVANKRFSDGSRLEWEIHQEDDSPEATQHAEALRYAYDHLEAVSVLDQDERGGVATLIRQMLTAHAMRYSVHEIVLRVDSASGRQVTAELRHCPVWFFEARRGRLAFLKSEWDIRGELLEDGRWLRTVGLGLMRPVSVAYACKHFPLRDWLMFCSRFGLPAVHGETTALPESKEFDDFSRALEAFINGLVVVTGVGAKVNLIESRTSGSLPFADVVEMVNRSYAAAFRGGDLSTQSRDGQSVGSNPQEQEMGALLEDDARLVSETLNVQFDRPLIRYLYGVEPKAWFQLLPPKRILVDQDIKSAEFLVKHGVPVGQKTARLRLGWPEPEEGDDLLEAAAPPMMAPVGPGPLANEGNRLHARSKEVLGRSMEADLAPLRRRLEAIEAIQDPEIRRARLQSLLAEWDSLTEDILADPEAAQALAAIQGAAVANGLAAPRPTRRKKS